MRVIHFPTQFIFNPLNILRNFYPQMPVIFPRLIQNKPYLPSIPQAFRYLEGCCVIQKRVRVRKNMVPCDSRGGEDKQVLQGETVPAVRNYLNEEHLRAPLWPLEVMGSCPLTCPSRGGRLAHRPRRQRLLDCRGRRSKSPCPLSVPPREMPVHGGQGVGTRAGLICRWEESAGQSEDKVGVVPSSLSARQERRACFPLRACFPQGPHEECGFGVRQG